MIDKVMGGFSLIIMLTLTSVILSKKANTANVIQAGVGGIVEMIKAATSTIK